ncbi:hypothetical protein FACS1894184_11630 [Clostridia bacterium]|nr:hypothetical protein FACS1894184_11630 [Clostridia bacterium]
MDDRDNLAIYIQVAMAVFGALARIMRASNEQVRNVWRIVGDLFAAAFSGTMMYWLSAEVKLSPELSYMMAGVAGWVGPSALDAVIRFAVKKTGIPLAGENNESKDGDQL